MCTGAVTAGRAWAGAAAIQDVPPDHWAYQAVRTMLSKGYLSLRSDGTFSGSQPVDRYTLASVVAELLGEVGSGSQNASADDVATLRRLATEYHDELVRYYQRLQATEDQSKKLQKSQDVLQEKLSQVIAAVDGLQRSAGQNVDGLQKSIGQTNQQLKDEAAQRQRQDASFQAELKRQADALQAQADQLAKLLERRTQELSQATAASNNALAGSLRQEIAQTVSRLQQEAAAKAKAQDQKIAAAEQRLGGLENKVAEGQAVTALVQESVEKHSATLGQLKKDGDALGARVNSLDQTVGTIRGKIGLSEDQLKELAKRLQDEMASQLNLTLVREDRLERQLRELQAEFNSYKSASNDHINTLKNTGTITTVAAVVGILIGLFKP